MKILFLILGVSLGLAAAAWGDDMKTLTGNTYSNFVVQQYDSDGYVVIHDGGFTNVLFSEISPGLRGHYKALSTIPISRTRRGGEAEAPAGPGDLVTHSGQIYRNITVKKVEENRILIAHDTGIDTVYFSSLPDEMQVKVRSMSVKPDAAPGTDDIITSYGVVFRNTEIIREEPDGLTFTHDGGVTKLGFPALSVELGEKYGYEPMAAWKYGRDQAAKKATTLSLSEDKPNGPATFTVYAVETEKLPDDKFWVRFAVKNITDEPLSIVAVPCEKQMRPIFSQKTLEIPPQSSKELQQFVILGQPPAYLKVSTDTHYTNTLLNWE